MDESKRVNRRRFFREGLRELLKPLARSVEPLEQAIRQMQKLEEAANTLAPAGQKLEGEPAPPRSTALPLVWLRPPGAIDEERLASTCTRGGECVKVCPAHAIQIDPTGAAGGGLPYIDANAMACVACDGLYCMAACPSGALVATPLTLIDMGLAVWRSGTCLRTHGDSCTLCVDKCPMGSAAIRLDASGGVEVRAEGCIGCGVCQHECPTLPKSIAVTPKSLLDE